MAVYQLIGGKITIGSSTILPTEGNPPGQIYVYRSEHDESFTSLPDTQILAENYTNILQQSYDNSIEPEILTSDDKGPLSLKRGSSADTDDVLEVLNGAGVKKTSITGEGKVSGVTLSLLRMTLDSNSTVGETGMLLSVAGGPHLRVRVEAADSGGVGVRLLTLPNA